MQDFTDDELGPWMALFSVPQLSLRLSHKLLAQLSSPQAILSLPAKDLRQYRVKPAAIEAILAYQANPEDSSIGVAVQQACQWLSLAADHHIIHRQHPDYPLALREIAYPPLLLFVMGNRQILQQPQIAIVGSRNPSVSGKELAHQFAQYLSQAGFVVTSGLALGIDGASHEGAIAEQGATIAVMATGIDRIYPRRHEQLANIIREQGALITEFPLGTVPRPQNFPQRNRIISGLSLGVLVVEAAVRSGSLITARCALEQNREVFAIPGSVHNPLAKGCHALIRQGAKLVETGADIVEEIEPLLATGITISPTAPADINDDHLQAQHRLVLQQMGYDAISMDCLVERTELSVTELSALLTELSLMSQIEIIDGGYVRIFTKTPRK